MDTKFDNHAEPPGVFVREELEARGWSQRDLAYILGVSEQTITKLVSGKQGVSADMAKGLAEAFGTSAEVWANLESAHQLRHARDPGPEVRSRAVLQEVFPIREMIRRGWFQESDQTLLELQVTRFFEVGSIGELPRMRCAAKRTSYDDDPPEQIAWLYRARQIARGLSAPSYSEENLREALPRLRELTLFPEDVRHVPAILNECGVRFVVVESLPNGKIDGVCTWLDDSQPVIGMSTFHDRLDNFWFVLRHEIEHVLCGHGKELGILDNLDGEAASDSENIAEEERIANSAALSFCFPRESIKAFYARKAPFVSERDVVGFSARMEVHPAVVVGQVQFLKDDYRFLRKYLVKIRHFLLDEAAFDGWGSVAHTTL